VAASECLVASGPLKCAEIEAHLEALQQSEATSASFDFRCTNIVRFELVTEEYIIGALWVRFVRGASHCKIYLSWVLEMFVLHGLSPTQRPAFFG
jgi:hypothetical protein